MRGRAQRAPGSSQANAASESPLEPITRFETYLLNRAEQALAMVADVDLPNVGVCLDTYHMNQEEQDPLAAIRALGPRMFDFHVADSNRRPPGQGAIDWPAILAPSTRSSYEGHLTAEVDPPRDCSRLATVPEEDGEFASDYYDAGRRRNAAIPALAGLSLATGNEEPDRWKSHLSTPYGREPLSKGRPGLEKAKEIGFDAVDVAFDPVGRVRRVNRRACSTTSGARDFRFAR